MGTKTTGLVVLAILAGAIALAKKELLLGWFQQQPDSGITIADTQADDLDASSELEPEIPLKTEAQATSEQTPTPEVAESALTYTVILAERETFYTRFDLTEIGTTQLNDGEFNALVAYLKDDAVLFAQFLAEYRANTDPARARRMAQVLDEFDDGTITTLAAELVYSGEVSSQKAGLDLLAGQQQTNLEAREIVTQVLEIESDPQILSAALNALAKPGETTDEQRDQLLNQFALHSSNEDPAVRRRSLSLMSRWSGELNMNDHYISALDDPDKGVRTGALLSLMGSGHRDELAYQSLVKVLENTNESMQMRRNALLGLEKYALSAEDKQQFLDTLSGRR